MRSPPRADCGRCAALCCLAPAFAASADFAVDKDAGTPCAHLREDLRRGIHADLRDRGFAGCTVYDCFGAGQRVVQDVLDGRDWRRDPDLAARMFAVFPIVRQLHELVWYLPGRWRCRWTTRCARTCTGGATRPNATACSARRARAAGRRTAADRGRRPAAARERGRPRRAARRRPPRGRPRRRAPARGGTCTAPTCAERCCSARTCAARTCWWADLLGADLLGADLLGADLRGADLRGAGLDAAIFLLRAQVDAARGDRATNLPAALARPAHWVAALTIRPVGAPPR